MVPRLTLHVSLVNIAVQGTAKTASSELAGGNKELETRGMGLILGMWGA